jgi:lysozyme
MAHALAIIKAFEGLELEAYVDAVGVVTIGWGTTLYNDGRPIQKGDRVTPHQAEQLLREQVLRDYAPGVFKALPLARAFTPQQQAALVSFTYNVGVEALNESTLRKRLLSGEDPAQVIRQELPRWRFGDQGEVLAGLERRRAAEVDLFLS